MTQDACKHCDEPITYMNGVWVHNRGANHWAVSCPPRATRATPTPAPSVSVFAGIVKSIDYTPGKAAMLYTALALTSLDQGDDWLLEMRRLVAGALEEAGTVKAVCVLCHEVVRVTEDDVLFPCKCLAGWMWSSAPGRADCVEVSR